MTTTSQPTPLSDFKGLAVQVLQAISTAIDAIFGEVTTDLPTLSTNGLSMAEATIENLVPAGPIRALVSGIISSANAAAHAGIVSTLDAPALALLAVAKANVDLALSRLEASLGTSAASSAGSESPTSH